MNKNYKKLSALLVVFGALFSLNAWATPGDGATNNPAIREDRAAKKADILEKKEARASERNENLCEKIAERAETFGQKMSGEENKFQTRNQERLSRWTEKKSELEEKLDANRATWDANRDAQFKALEERAQTQEQKKAVADFEVKVRAAIETRRMAMDSAIKNFQDGVKSMIATRNGQVEQLLESAKTQRQTLLETAKSDCEAGKDAKTVMAAFRSGMQASRAKAQADKQSVAKVNTQISALIATRKTAVEKATTDFKAVMEQARVTLRKAFPAETEATQ